MSHQSVLIITNSQGTNSGLIEARAYPEILAKKLSGTVGIFTNAVSDFMISDFEKLLEKKVLKQNPGLVIFQIGIVECTTRILSKKEKEILYAISLGRHLSRMLFTLRSFVLRFRRTINRETRVLSEDDFRKNLTEIKSRLANTNIVFCRSQ